MSALVQVDRVAVPRAESATAEDRIAVGGALSVAEAPVRRPMTAADVMTRFPATEDRRASMWTAWDRLRTSGNRHLVLVDDHRRPVGVLDERALAVEWPAGPMAARRTPVHTLLRGTARPRVHGGTTLAAVARIMLGSRVDAVPVVDGDGRLLGLVTLWHFAGLVAAAPAGEG